MTDEKAPAKGQAWAEAVKTPLGFFAAVVVVLDGSLGVAGITTDRISLVYPFAVLALVILIVGLLAYLRPESLRGAKPVPLKVQIDFGEGTLPPELDPHGCVVRRSAQDKEGRAASPSWEGEGWQMSFDSDAVTAGGTVYLEMQDKADAKMVWTTRPFNPYGSRQKAVRSQGRQGGP